MRWLKKEYSHKKKAESVARKAYSLCNYVRHISHQQTQRRWGNNTPEKDYSKTKIVFSRRERSRYQTQHKLMYCRYRLNHHKIWDELSTASVMSGSNLFQFRHWLTNSDALKAAVFLVFICFFYVPVALPTYQFTSDKSLSWIVLVRYAYPAAPKSLVM